MLNIGDAMSYYFKSKYQFSDHGLLRIKNRLKVKKMSDLELKSYCEELIDTSHEIDETKTFKYVKVNKTNLYFIINKIDNLIITLTPIKPEKLLSNLEKNL
ncbi:hypothetical protein LT318_00229 [Spiroplasma sp. JKS002670]|nr:hypothetical protein [Spiroplasma sp. JKS002670]